MRAIDRIIYIAAVTLIIVAIICYARLQIKINTQAADIARLELQLSSCSEKERAVSAALERQNDAIAAVKVDTIKVIQKIKNIAQKYEVERAAVIERVEKDTSCENKIVVIDDIMRTFHSGGVRPQNGD